MKLKNIMIAILGFAVLTACEKEYEAEQIAGNNLSGEWFVQTYLGGTTAADVVLGYQKIVTSNTAAANGSEIWLDDQEHIWPFKVRCSASSGSNSFSATNMPNGYQGDTTFVTITEGKIFPNGGKSTSGITVDSIFFKASFSDDPGNEYIMAGHYRTGFIEDEH